jgi:RNA polymerase sigma-70 factor (ECF subfamily)
VDDAEEIENETYLRLWNIIPPEKPDFLKSFVCRIAKNISIDRARYNQANKRKQNEVIPVEEVADILSGKETPENLYEQKETSEYISDFLRLQKTEARRFFIQRYWYCFSISEIAKAFGVSENKVKVTLHRVRKDLKKYLEAKGVVL